MITSAIQRHGFISERLPAKTGNVSNTYELHFVTYVTRPYTRDPFTTMEEKFSIRSSVYLLRFFSIRTDHLFFLFLLFLFTGECISLSGRGETWTRPRRSGKSPCRDESRVSRSRLFGCFGQRLLHVGTVCRYQIRRPRAENRQ